MTSEFGFLNNKIDHKIPTRSLLGNPGFISRRGASTVFKANHINDLSNERQDAPHTASVAPSQSILRSILEKRCEYLEQQDKVSQEKFIATHDELKRLKASFDEKHIEKQIYEEGQWVFASAGDVLKGVTSNSLEHFTEDDQLSIVEHSDRILLVYPMKLYTKGDEQQCFMRMKSADKVTGQLCYTWVLIYENRLRNEQEKEIRYVTDFSVIA